MTIKPVGLAVVPEESTQKTRNYVCSINDTQTAFRLHAFKAP